MPIPALAPGVRLFEDDWGEAVEVEGGGRDVVKEVDAVLLLLVVEGWKAVFDKVDGGWDVNVANVIGPTADTTGVVDLVLLLGVAS